MEDGDIGYAGDQHLSFVGQPLGPIGGPATPFGSQMAQKVKQILSERVGNGARQSTTAPRRVTPQAYHSAVRRTLLGV